MKKNYKNKLLKYRLLLFLYAACLGGGASCLSDYKNGEEVVVSVPEDLRRELYDKNIISEKEESEMNITEDKYITENALSKLTEIQLYADKIDDFGILNMLPNLKTILIVNAEFLTDEDIEKINNSSVESVKLYFNLSNVEQTRENKFDVSRFKKSVILTNGTNYAYSDFVWISELYGLVLFNYLQNYDREMFVNQDYYHYYNDLNKKLDRIIEKNKMNEDIELDDKLYRISKYICNKIKYDEEIGNLQETSTYDKQSADELNIVHDYNRYSISSTINNTAVLGEVEGLCVNYADLFDILCYKLGIKSRVVSSYDEEIKDWSHKWNVVYIGDELKYVDIDLLDNSIKRKFVTVIDINENTKTTKVIKFSREEFDKYFYNDIEEYEETYGNSPSDAYSLETLDKKLEKEDTLYYNTQIDGEKVHNKPVNIPMALLFGVSAGWFSISLDKLDDAAGELVKKLKKTKRS